jgi:iron complex transport system substrate-binding protein
MAVRICSLLPSATEIVYALGLGDQLFAVSHECDYPPEAASKPAVIRPVFDASRLTSREIDDAVMTHLRQGTGVYAIDLDRLRRADPDLILTQELCDVCAVPYLEVTRAIEQLGSRPSLLSLSPALLGDVLRDVRRVGEAAGRVREAESVVERLQRRIDRVASMTAGVAERPATFCLEWTEPLYVAGHWVPEMVELAGGTDGLGMKGKPSTRIEWDRVVAYAPEVIVLMPCGFDVERAVSELPVLTRLPGWSDLPAVKRGRLYAVNATAYFSRSGPRLVDGLELMVKLIHPEIGLGPIPPDLARQVS